MVNFRARSFPGLLRFSMPWICKIEISVPWNEFAKTQFWGFKFWISLVALVFWICWGKKGNFAWMSFINPTKENKISNTRRTSYEANFQNKKLLAKNRPKEQAHCMRSPWTSCAEQPNPHGPLLMAYSFGGFSAVISLCKKIFTCNTLYLCSWNSILFWSSLQNLLVKKLFFFLTSKNLKNSKFWNP